MSFLYLAFLISACILCISYIESRSISNSRGLRRKRSILRNDSLRWSRDIPYEFSNNIPRRFQVKIEQALNLFRYYTFCVDFHPRRANESDYLYFKSDEEGCWAEVGKIGGQTPINLDLDGCYDSGTILHEILHAMGFEHEHVRSDRDQFINVFWNNIEPNQTENFIKEDPNEYDTQNLPYDYFSLMHYSAYAFSRNGFPTILPKGPYMNFINWEATTFSSMDLQKIFKAYCPLIEY